jgi:uncharacterized membrane protein YadS
VIGAALIYSQQAAAPAALAAASVAKLLRNLSIAVLIPAAAWLAQRQEAAAPAPEVPDSAATAGLPSAKRPPVVPAFVLAFIGFIVLRTAGDALTASTSSLWPAVVNTGYSASDLFLTCGMTAVGLSVAFTDMWRIGWRPLAAGLVVATLVGGCSLLLTFSMLHYLH